jgi:hypothetical protein
MADLKLLILSGNLLLSGTLKLATTSGGKVKVDSDEVLVEGGKGSGVPVIQPPPPGSPIDKGTGVEIKRSFNSTVTANDKAIVAQGVCLQGDTSIWPCMVLPSTRNLGAVKANGIPINVVGDSGITLLNGGSITFDQSGQMP